MAKYALVGMFMGLILAWGHNPLPPPGRPTVASTLPQGARHVLAYIRTHHEPPPGYEGGRRFGNYERQLPQVDEQGRRIEYQEWDVHPHEAHVNRGVERLITGSDGRAWYTRDHYEHFVEMESAP